MLPSVWNVSANDLLQDVASAFDPDEWLGVDVVMGDVLVDGVDEFGHAGLSAPFLILANAKFIYQEKE